MYVIPTGTGYDWKIACLFTNGDSTTVYTYKILFVLEYDVHLKLILLCDYVID